MDDETPDHFYELERVRRINNIVYCGALCIGADGDFSALEGVGFGRKQLLDLIPKLHPSGIGEVLERTVIHTIGTAYHLLSEPEKARAAGERFLDLVAESGDDLSQPHLARLAREVLTWRVG